MTLRVEVWTYPCEENPGGAACTTHGEFDNYKEAFEYAERWLDVGFDVRISVHAA